ncbi:oligosaccharyl transferase subunit OST3/OST6 family protein [Ceratobasidium sp. AG-Ba]|nr:oligosaccharyl transferase subunit OST3/OST6 family protein [Ceratobasidium sp. AG-Ba]
MHDILSTPRQANYVRIDDTPELATTHPYSKPADSLCAASSSVTMVPHLTKGPGESTTAQSRHPVPKRRMKLLFTYSLDWIVTIIIIGLFYLLDRIEGFKRQFSLTDTSIQHTFAVHERVPPFALYMIALVAPAVLMPIVNLLTVRSWWDWHNSASIHLLERSNLRADHFVLAPRLAWTPPWFGNHRFTYTGRESNRGPSASRSVVSRSSTRLYKTLMLHLVDLIDRCQPSSGAANASPYGLVSAGICTSDDHERLKDGFRSFFSGHSSLSFAGLGFLSFYLAGKMHLFDERGHTGKAWIALTPLTGALLVAISRTMDYRHHWQDVLIGSVVGLVLSYFSYRQYYPSLTSPFSHRPYSPRIPRYQQEQAGIPSPDAETIRSHNHLTAEPTPNGVESIELSGTVKRGGEDLSEMWRREREEEHTQNQRAAAREDPAQNV